MPYQIKKYDGTELLTIPDYQYNDTSSTLVLFGKGVTNYGQPMGENLIHMLEHFAGPTPPGLPARLGNPLVGQLWYDTSIRKLRVRSQTTNWDVVGSVNTGTTPPNPPNAGDMWLDTSTQPPKMRIWNGTNWQLISSAAVASSQNANSTTGNATSATSNYFNTTALGNNAAASMGDLWYDPAVGRLKVYTGSYWQIVGSPLTGVIDTSIANNTKMKPTASTTTVGLSSTGNYHTGAMGVFVAGDTVWDDQRNQLFIMNEWGGLRKIGPLTPVRDPLNTNPSQQRNFCDDFHFSAGTYDYRATAVNGQVVGIFTGEDTLVGNLPQTYSTDFGFTNNNQSLTLPIRQQFNSGSLSEGQIIKTGMNYATNLTVHQGHKVSIGGDFSYSILTVGSETPGDASVKLGAYMDAGTFDLKFHRSRNNFSSRGQVLHNDSLGRITWTGQYSASEALVAGIEAFVDGTPSGTSFMPGRLEISTSGDTRFTVTDNYLIASDATLVKISNTGGQGKNASNTGPSNETPSYVFNTNRTTGMSSPAGDSLNLVVNGTLVEQLRVDGGTLFGDWWTTGNHYFGSPYYKAMITRDGDIHGIHGVFADVKTDTLTVNNETIQATSFMRNDGSVSDPNHAGNLSRRPLVSAAVDGSGGFDFGTSSQRWGIFYGVAAAANYADVAERYESDRPLDEGTVVKIGGEKEIIPTTSAFDDEVFGVISIAPAFAMNDAAGPTETHPYVALAGRIKCKVTGNIRKGQRVVSSEIEGVAQAADTSVHQNILSIIGRALETKTTDGIGLVEIVVGKN